MNTATRKYSLMVILAAYAVIGGLYATRIPPWQAPDEPAHYNYVRQLAQTGAYPVIEMGDYDQALLSQKVAPPDARPSFPLDAIQYEDHQPPLFYTLAAPVFVAFDGSLVALRLFTLLIGALAVTFTYLAVLEVFPSQPGIAAFAAAWVALLPQHVHMAASLNNDALSEALIALTLWLSARLVMVAGRGAGAGEQGSEGGGAVTRRAPPASRRALVLLGIVVGLSLLTKAQAYLCLPVALAAVFMATHGRQPGRAVARDLGIVLAVGLVLGTALVAAQHAGLRRAGRAGLAAPQPGGGGPADDRGMDRPVRVGRAPGAHGADDVSVLLGPVRVDERAAGP